MKNLSKLPAGPTFLATMLLAALVAPGDVEAQELDRFRDQASKILVLPPEKLVIKELNWGNSGCGVGGSGGPGGSGMPGDRIVRRNTEPPRRRRVSAGGDKTMECGMGPEPVRKVAADKRIEIAEPMDAQNKPTYPEMLAYFRRREEFKGFSEDGETEERQD